MVSAMIANLMSSRGKYYFYMHLQWVRMAVGLIVGTVLIATFLSTSAVMVCSDCYFCKCDTTY